MSDILREFVDAPWTTILTLASGYAGYFVAHVGLRDHHQPLDQAFRVIFYGFWGIFAHVLARSWAGVDILTASLIAVAASALLGAFWRKTGKKLLSKLLRDSGISMSDDIPTAWSALAEVGEDVDAYQLKVCLIDGTLFFCNDLSRFKDFPNGACVLGGAGDVLMYVTDVGKISSSGEREWKQVPGILNEDYGAAITYIPKDQIARVEIRRAKRRSKRA